MRGQPTRQGSNKKHRVAGQHAPPAAKAVRKSAGRTPNPTSFVTAGIATTTAVTSNSTRKVLKPRASVVGIERICSTVSLDVWDGMLRLSWCPDGEKSRWRFLLAALVLLP